MTLEELIIKGTGYESIGLYTKNGDLIGECEVSHADVLKHRECQVLSFKTGIFDRPVHGKDYTEKYIRLCIYLDL